MNKVSECLHCADHGRNAAVAIYLQLKDIADRVVGRPAQLTQQAPVETEVILYRKWSYRFNKPALSGKLSGLNVVIESGLSSENEFFDRW